VDIYIFIYKNNTSKKMATSSHLNTLYSHAQNFLRPEFPYVSQLLDRGFVKGDPGIKTWGKVSVSNFSYGTTNTITLPRKAIYNIALYSEMASAAYVSDVAANAIQGVRIMCGQNELMNIADYNGWVAEIRKNMPSGMSASLTAALGGAAGTASKSFWACLPFPAATLTAEFGFRLTAQEPLLLQLATNNVTVEITMRPSTSNTSTGKQIA
jgi:hypothetical protein